MDISISIEQSIADINVSGDLNQAVITHNFWQSQQAQEVKGVKHINVNLKDIEHADTAGLAWLLNLKRDVSLAGKQCQMVNVPSKILELAKLSGADTLLSEGESDDK